MMNNKGVVIRVGITSDDARAIKFLNFCARTQLEELEKKLPEDAEEWTGKQADEYCHLINIHGAINKIEQLINNEYAIMENTQVAYPGSLTPSPEAIDKYLELIKRQNKCNRERIRDLGIHVDIFSPDSSKARVQEK